MPNGYRETIVRCEIKLCLKANFEASKFLFVLILVVLMFHSTHTLEA